MSCVRATVQPAKKKKKIEKPEALLAAEKVHLDVYKGPMAAAREMYLNMDTATQHICYYLSLIRDSSNLQLFGAAQTRRHAGDMETRPAASALVEVGGAGADESTPSKRHFARDHNHQPQTIIDPFVDEVVTFVTTMSKQLYKCAHPCGWYHIHIPTHTQHPHTHRLLVPEPPPSIFGSGRTPGGLSASRTNVLLYPNAHSRHTPQHLLYYYSHGRCFA